jgi:hypothetical protein
VAYEITIFTTSNKNRDVAQEIEMNLPNYLHQSNNGTNILDIVCLVA